MKNSSRGDRRACCSAPWRPRASCVRRLSTRRRPCRSARRSPRRATRFGGPTGEYPLPDGGTRLEFAQGRSQADLHARLRRRRPPRRQAAGADAGRSSRPSSPACRRPTCCRASAGRSFGLSDRLAAAAGLELPLRRPRGRLRRCSRSRSATRPASSPRPARATDPACDAGSWDCDADREPPSAARVRQAASNCRSTNGRMPPCR